MAKSSRRSWAGRPASQVPAQDGNLSALLKVRRSPSWTALLSPPDWRSLWENVWATDPVFQRPGFERALGEARRVFDRKTEELREGLRAVEWRRVPSQALCSLLEASLFVDIGTEKLLPPDVARELLPDDRSRVFFETLLRYGILESLRQKLEAPPGAVKNPLELALRNRGAQLAGQPAWQEITQRGRRHVGFGAAMYFWAKAVGELHYGGMSGPAVEEVVTHALNKLGGAGEKKQKEMTKGVGVARGKRTPEQRRSRVAEALEKKWGKSDDPFALLALALDGHLNIAPTVIASRHIEAARKRARAMANVRARRDSIVMQFAERSDPAPAPDEVAVWREFGARVQNYPRLREFLEEGSNLSEREQERRRAEGRRLLRRLFKEEE